LNTFGQEGAVLGPVVGAFGEMSAHVDFLADLSYYGDRGSKTAQPIYCLVHFRAWGLMLSCRDLVQASIAVRDFTQHPPRARRGYNEEAAYNAHMNPEPGF